MANALFDKARQRFLEGQFNWNTDTIKAVLVDTGTDSTSPLIAFIDTATGLPITPNGGDIIVTWDNGPNKLFKL